MTEPSNSTIAQNGTCAHNSTLYHIENVTYFDQKTSATKKMEKKYNWTEAQIDQLEARVNKNYIFS